MSRRKKTFLFIPYELTEHDMLRNASKSNSIFYSLGYTIHSDSQNSAHDDVVLILGFYNSSTESEQLCSSCCMKVDSTDFLHICAKSLRKYNFHHSCIQRYYPLSNSNDTIMVWISLDMNVLPLSLKHGVIKKYAKICENHDSSNNNNNSSEVNNASINLLNGMQNIMEQEIGEQLNRLICWFNKHTSSSSSTFQYTYKMKLCKLEKKYFIEMIKEFLSKVINKLVHFSYTLSLIQYHFDITTSKLSTDCLTQHDKSKNHDKIDGNIIITSSLSNGYPSSKLPYIPDASLSIIGAVQLLILILCLITIPYKNYYDYNNGKCCKQNADNLYHSMCSTSSSSKHTYYSSRVTPIIDTGGEVTTATATAVSSSRSISSSSIQASWLPNDLNCKTIPTLGLFYLDDEEENYTRRTLSTSLSSVSLLSTSFTSFVFYNSTEDIVKYLYPTPDYCWMNVLYRCTEYFTCELTRFLLWLESGKPAGLKMNLHLAYLMGQFFLYHILAWRSYVTFIIYLFMYILSVLKQLTEVNSFNVYFLANFTTIICLIFSTVYMLSSLYKEKMINLSLIKVFMIYFSTIIRLMLGLFACLLLDIIELMTLHLTSFYIYATHLLRLQSRTIAASWRLCRDSSKWNPLRNRVDKIPDMFIDPNELLLTISSLHKRISTSPSPSLISSSSDKENHLLQYDKEVENYSEPPKSMEQRDMLYKFVSNKQNSDTLIDQLNKQTCGVYLDRLLVSTLLGLAIGLCLYSTTIAFYITFTCIQLFLLLIKNILKSAVWFIMDFPLESFLLWIFNSSYYQTKLILEAPRRDLKQCSFLRLKLTRIDFHEMYTQSHLIHKPLFPKRLSISELVYRLICAQDIR